MTRYLFVIEPTASGFSAFSPDLPGCAAAGATREETEARMREAIEFHVEGLRRHGKRVPAPTSFVAFAEVT